MEDRMLDAIKDRLPGFARDAKLNLGIVGAPGELAPRVAWGTALAAAATARNPELLAAVRAAAAPHLDAAHEQAALAAASLMAMNNVFYRFRHFMGPASPYPDLPARLRMQGLANHGIEPQVFELWCLAVSAINGCEACVRSHEQVVRDKGGTPQQVHDAVRIAAVIQAVAVSLELGVTQPAAGASAA
jgi:alkyl hydroperoxide reductase subunit D